MRLSTPRRSADGPTPTHSHRCGIAFARRHLSHAKSRRIVSGVDEEKPTYTAHVRIVREQGPIRQAYLPAEHDAVVFGTHDEVREHYGTAPGQYPDHATTLDYVVAAAAG